jgi:predicted O-methyltransferase YrrM
MIPPGEVAAAVEAAFKIPGLYRRAEAGFLYRLARRRGNLVEVGSWMGRTTSLLVQAAKKWDAAVYSVDPFTPMPSGHEQGAPERWRANLIKLGLEPPHLYHMPSLEAASVFDQEVALLFIDGDHGERAVLADLQAWTPKVKLGGVVALHDMFYPTITGVCRAVTEWWTEDRGLDGAARWQLLGLHDFTIAFKRLM